MNESLSREDGLGMMGRRGCGRRGEEYKCLGSGNGRGLFLRCQEESRLQWRYARFYHVFIPVLFMLPRYNPDQKTQEARESPGGEGQSWTTPSHGPAWDQSADPAWPAGPPPHVLLATLPCRKAAALVQQKAAISPAACYAMAPPIILASQLSAKRPWCVANGANLLSSEG